MQKAITLRQKTIEELVDLSKDLSKQIFTLKNELKVNQKLEKPHMMNRLKKDRARVLTVLSESNK
jgi:ribosomal protein L29